MLVNYLRFLFARRALFLDSKRIIVPWGLDLSHLPKLPFEALSHLPAAPSYGRDSLQGRRGNDKTTYSVLEVSAGNLWVSSREHPSTGQAKPSGNGKVLLAFSTCPEW